MIPTAVDKGAGTGAGQSRALDQRVGDLPLVRPQLCELPGHARVSARVECPFHPAETLSPKPVLAPSEGAAFKMEDASCATIGDVALFHNPGPDVDVRILAGLIPRTAPDGVERMSPGTSLPQEAPEDWAAESIMLLSLIHI